MHGEGPIREEVGGALLTAALAALVAAVAGGIVWGLTVRWSGYEVGFVAWGIGFVVGTAVVLGARASRGVPYQVVAVVLALLGILGGRRASRVAPDLSTGAAIQHRGWPTGSGSSRAAATARA